MRITTRLTIDMSTNAILKHEWHEYSGPVQECKGGASRAEQAAADQQRAMQNQLMQQQLAMQQGQINMVNPTLQKIISSGGLLPDQQAALTAIYMNQLPNTLRQGMGQINQNLVARGLTGGPTGAGGGGVAGDFGQLTAMLGALQQEGATGVEMAKMQGLNQAMNTTLGIGGMYGQNVGTFNSGASNALNSGVEAAKNVDAASTSWMGPVFGALGSLGSGWATGGFKKPGCWIAKELYGSWLDPRVMFIRARLAERARKQLTFAAIVVAYSAIGKQVARLVKKSTRVRRIALRVFDSFLRNEMDFVLNQAVRNFGQ